MVGDNNMSSGCLPTQDGLTALFRTLWLTPTVKQIENTHCFNYEDVAGHSTVEYTFQ